MERKKGIIYVRISRAEGESIANQQAFLENFLSKKEEFSAESFQVIADEGYTGTNMNRPGIKKLLSMVSREEVFCILVRDFSRFSRDYLMTGYYLEQFFPQKGIRFISVNDHYDSAGLDGRETERITLQAFLYDWYTRDLSGKVRAVKRAQAAKGLYMGSRPPFGYEKRENCLYPDEKKAQIIKDIFSLASSGMTDGRIAAKLNRNKIPPPSGSGGWRRESVAYILTNPVYIGTAVSGKSSRPNLKCSRKKTKPDGWICRKAVHEPLVSEELFKKAQIQRAKRRKEKPADKRGTKQNTAHYEASLYPLWLTIRE